MTKEEIHSICGEYSIYRYIINSDMSISVEGNVNLQYRDLYRVPLKFKEVMGNFHCNENRLMSLIGCPEIVSGGFFCYGNRLKSLEFSPREVGGDFSCGRNQIKSLRYSPERIGGRIIASMNRLESLEFCPKSGTNTYALNDNKISSFDGLPEFFYGHIDVTNTRLEEIYRLFKNNPDCIEYLKEFDVIRGNTVIRDRLEEVFIHMGMKVPKIEFLQGYVLR